MLRKNKVFAGAVGIFFFLGWQVQPANATLIGDTITIQGGFNTLAGLTVIDPGAEYIQSDPKLTETVDVFASSFTLTQQNLTLTAFVGTTATYILSDLDWFNDPTGGLISNVVLASASVQNGTTLSGLTFSDSLGVDSGTISFNTAGSISPQATSQWLFQITATHPVPEPATLAIFLVGLAGLGFMTRRRRNRRRQT